MAHTTKKKINKKRIEAQNDVHWKRQLSTNNRRKLSRRGATHKSPSTTRKRRTMSDEHEGTPKVSRAPAKKTRRPESQPKEGRLREKPTD